MKKTSLYCHEETCTSPSQSLRTAQGVDRWVCRHHAERLLSVKRWKVWDDESA